MSTEEMHFNEGSRYIELILTETRTVVENLKGSGDSGESRLIRSFKTGLTLTRIT